ADAPASLRRLPDLPGLGAPTIYWPRGRHDIPPTFRGGAVECGRLFVPGLRCGPDTGHWYGDPLVPTPAVPLPSVAALINRVESRGLQSSPPHRYRAGR